MKGIVLAGGSGSRLNPITRGVSKQLLPVYDKPMVYYPLSILMLAGIRDILLISTPDDQSNFKRLLGNGSDFGINLNYLIQKNPDGLAQSFIIGEDFIGDDDVCLVLGDNIFYGQGLTPKLKRAAENAESNKKATIFGYQVNDPHRFGVVSFDENNSVVSIEEKPSIPKSNFAITGLYFYPNSVVDVAKTIKPTLNNELQITCVNNKFLEMNKLDIELFERGFAWLDSGTHDSLVEASQFVQTIEKRQGYKIACLEEIAYYQGWLSKKQLTKLAKPLMKSGYGEYLMDLVKK